MPGDMVTGIPRVKAQSVFAPASTASAAQPGVLASFGADVTTNSCRGCTLRLSADGGILARVATGSLQRHAYAVLDLGSRAIDGQIAAHDVIGLGLGETPVTFVHVLQMSDVMHRVIFELVADPQRQLHLYSPAGGLRNRPLDIALGATVPNDGVSGVAVDIVTVEKRDLGLRQWRPHRPAHRAQRSSDLRAPLPGGGRRPLQRTSRAQAR